ncbi:MAG TPA: hypothetical protein VIV54_10450 [Burkholderiales bacterium]
MNQTQAVALAAAILLGMPGCSSDEGAPSIVSEAQATAAPAGPDYGWKSRVVMSESGAAAEGTVYEYH